MLAFTNQGGGSSIKVYESQKFHGKIELQEKPFVAAVGNLVLNDLCVNLCRDVPGSMQAPQAFAIYVFHEQS